MAFCSPDLHVAHILKHALAEVRANPAKYIPDIYGSLTNDVHVALFGKPYLEKIEKWLTSTKIPVVLGYDLSQTELPALTVVLSSMSPGESFIGDYGFDTLEPRQPQDRDVLIPRFSPKAVTFNASRTRATITPPEAMNDYVKSLIAPGLHIRDAKKQEFRLGQDETTSAPYITSLDNGTALNQGDFSSIEVISPYSDQVFTNGAMLYNVELEIVVHANQNRQDAIWLWQFAMWAMLKYRPLMTKLFGLDLTFSSSSDFMKVSDMEAENVWTRKIRVSTKCMWSWSAEARPDILSLLLYYRFGEASDTPPGEERQYSPEDLEAINWARANPSDPRAALILQYLGLV